MSDAVPAVAERRRAPQRGLALAPEYQRRVRLLDRLRLELHGPEGHVPPVELGLGLGLGPERPHVLPRARRPRAEIHPDRRELIRQPADADAEREPSSREHVETPLTIVELFGDTPRALARTPDGRTVYAAVFNSGNGTTTLPSWVVTANGGLPPPPSDSRLFPDRFPPVGLIVKVDPDGRWRDETGRDWSTFVPFSLPDYDVFAIDADAPVPVETGSPVSGVGTTLFDLAVRPSTGEVYVTNLEARNQIRFAPVLRGHVVDNRVTVITGGQAHPVDLNPHIDRGRPGGEPAVIERSLALPTALAFTADGSRVFVAAFGSGKVARLDAGALATGQVAGEQLVVGAGPSGLALDAASDRLYVMNQLDHTISVVAGASGSSPQVLTTVSVGYDPTPETIRRGRPFLYDARISSGYGDAACASCHIFGDTDHLAWDLGDPYGHRVPNRNKPVAGLADGFAVRRFKPFHPMKGPMGTQSLRGLANAGPMHWRGDRTGANIGRPLDERAAFRQFNQTFVALLGRMHRLKKSDMRTFAEFVLTMRYPPNPVAPFSGAGQAGLGPRAEAGRRVFDGGPNPFANGTCATCHLPVLDRFVNHLGRSTNPTVAEPQQFKVPHLRNLYQKVGLFGVAPNPFGVPTLTVGPQVRGFGFLHDGSVSTLTTFFEAAGFTFPTEDAQQDMEEFLLEFPTGFHAGVGLESALVQANLGDPRPASGGDACTYIVHTLLGGRRRGGYLARGGFQLDRRADAPVPFTSLLESAEAPVVEACVPSEVAVRLAVDRDEDGIWDGDEADAATSIAAP